MPAHAKTASPVQPKERSRTAVPVVHSLRGGMCPHWSVMGHTASCVVGDAMCCGAAYAGISSGFGTACARSMLPGGRPQHSEPARRINPSVTMCACVSCESVWWTCRAGSVLHDAAGLAKRVGDWRRRHRREIVLELCECLRTRRLPVLCNRKSEAAQQCQWCTRFEEACALTGR